MSRFFKKELPAIAMLFGGIIGAGMFAVPYAAAQAGFFIAAVYIVALGLIITVLHLFYGETILRTASKHRLVGYVRLYLGKGAESIEIIAAILGMYGALLAYGIIAGNFLEMIFKNALPALGAFEWSLIFFGAALFIVYFGIKAISKAELVFSLLLLAVVGLIWAKTAPFLSVSFLQGYNPANVFMPYGVAFFALIGFSSIPELRELFGGNRGEAAALKRTIISGTWLSVAAVLTFTWAVVGVTGPETSQDALSGLFESLDGYIITWGALLGIIAVFTSFLVNADNLKRTFMYDFGWQALPAWIITAAVPVLLFISGLTNLISIVGFAGAVTGGVAGIMIVLVHRQAKKRGKRRPEYTVKSNGFLRVFLILLFVLGVIYQLSVGF